MTNEELDTAFNDAQAEWLKAHPMTTYDDAQHRYFFWAGSQFGLESGARIYRETFGRPMSEEVEGNPI